MKLIDELKQKKIEAAAKECLDERENIILVLTEKPLAKRLLSYEDNAKFFKSEGFDVSQCVRNEYGQIQWLVSVP